MYRPVLLRIFCMWLTRRRILVIRALLSYFGIASCELVLKLEELKGAENCMTRGDLLQ